MAMNRHWGAAAIGTPDAGAGYRDDPLGDARRYQGDCLKLPDGGVQKLSTGDRAEHARQAGRVGTSLWQAAASRSRPAAVRRLSVARGLQSGTRRRTALPRRQGYVRPGEVFWGIHLPDEKQHTMAS